MSALANTASALLFSITGTVAIGVIADSLTAKWPRIVAALRGKHERAPADMVSTGAPSLHTIAGRRSKEVARSFPSQARRGLSLSTIRPRGEMGQ